MSPCGCHGEPGCRYNTCPGDDVGPQPSAMELARRAQLRALFEDPGYDPFEDT